MNKKKLFPTMSQDEYLKAIAVRPKSILTSNSKLAKDNIYNVTFPAQHALINTHGMVDTCPSAGACKAYCYASSGAYIFKSAMIKHARNLDYLMNDPFEFANQLIKEIKSKRKLKYVRIHDSADYHDASWPVFKAVMEACPDVRFYSYTKRISMFKSLKAMNAIPANFTYVFSYGGTEDHLIDKNNDRHAIAFESRKALREHRYTEAYASDIPASNPNTLRVGLIAHGNHLAMKRIKKAIGIVAKNSLKK